MATKNLSEYDLAKVPDASNMTFGVVVAEWNPEITGALLDGCVSTLEKHGALPENIHVKTVPGSFELIYGARQMTLNDGYDAIIILGSVIRGETPHFDYICQGVTEGIARLNATSNIPVVFGLLTTNDLQQAKDRAGGRLGNKGDECAVVAIDYPINNPRPIERGLLFCPSLSCHLEIGIKNTLKHLEVTILLIIFAPIIF